MRRVLEPAGIKLTIARSGEQALKLLRRRRFDLVIINFKLSGIDGLEVCRCLKLDPDRKHIPVIFLDGDTSQAIENEALRLGAKDIVHRPYKNGDLKARVLAQLPLPAHRTGHKTRREATKES